jgi:hypothetical protein
VGLLKKFNGSSWVDVPFKKWSGSSWVEPEVKKWDGSKWVIINQQQYTTTWNATWSQTYRSTNEKRTDTRGNSNLMQGDSGLDPWNINRSLCGFGDIRSTLAGAKIDDVKLYLRSEHWWYYSGGTAVIGYHNHSSEPSTFSHSKYGAKSQKFDYRGHAQWIDMPNALGEGIRDGSYKGFSIYANSTSKSYYGEFNGAGSSYRPKLKITYTK